jgi:hypothetical protein
MLLWSIKKKMEKKNRMNKLKNQKATIATAFFLILVIGTSMAFLPPTNAHTPIWTFESYAYIVASPNPVGVGQTVAVVMWIDGPLLGATVTNDIRRHDYKLTITQPNGNVETKNWPVVSDTTSVQYLQYTPDQVGNYSFKFDYPKQTYTWTSSTPGANTAYTNDTWGAASKTITLTVQEEPIPAAPDSYPLPTEYWTRPIEGQNTYWYSIASNWLGAPYIIGAGAGYGIPGAVQPDGAAPNSSHVMWAKPIQWGGVVGGSGTQILGEMFYSGLSYNSRFANPIIMNGVLYYQEPWGNGGGGGDYVAVNLQTGKEQWRINASATGVSLVPSFGYMYSLETENQHGVLPNGILVATQSVTGLGTVWRAYDARTGYLTTMNVSNVPSGTSLAGPSGELLRYTLTNLGNNSNPNYYLTQWNSSRVFGGASGTGVGGWYSGNTPANCPITPANPGGMNWNGSMWVSTTVRAAQGYAAVSTAAYDWNISIPSLKTAGWNVGVANLNIIPLVSYNDIILLVQGGFGGHPGDFGVTVSTDPGNVTAISLKSPSLGNVIWSQTYQPAPGNNSRLIVDWDPSNSVFVFADKESITHSGFSLADGKQIWTTETPTDNTIDYNFMALGLDRIAYGKLYVSGYAGILYAYDVMTGEKLWSYGNGGEGNSTLSGFVTPYGRYPLFISTIADGKIYLDTTEHSPNSPLYKDARYRCVNATTGEEIWTLLDYGNQMYGGQAPIADGYLTTLNSYDSRIYCIGKGPSQLTVTAPDLAAASGQPVVIRGTITDISAGTKQDEQAARFPNGVPAMSDSSMDDWMAYIYMQKPIPMSATGVPIEIDVLDSNGNFRNIGTATSDANGVFSFTWKPDIEGTYTVFATFAGTNSYYPAHAETSFAVMGAAPTQSPEPVAAAPAPVEMYFVGSTIAIIIAVALATLLIIKKK